MVQFPSLGIWLPWALDFWNSKIFFRFPLSFKTDIIFLSLSFCASFLPFLHFSLVALILLGNRALTLIFYYLLKIYLLYPSLLLLYTKRKWPDKQFDVSISVRQSNFQRYMVKMHSEILTTEALFLKPCNTLNWHQFKKYIRIISVNVFWYRFLQKRRV